MSSVAVVAHAGKSIGGGLRELHALLDREGVTDPLWYEVAKSKRAPRFVRQAVDRGADVVFVWGGDGMVQRSIDAMASLPEKQRVPIAIVPAGTANLLASNLGIDSDINTAVVVGLHGARKPLDVGVMNGERFAVMAGTGFDALLMGDVDSGRKSKLGRLAYVWSGTKFLRMSVECRISTRVCSSLRRSASSVSTSSVTSRAIATNAPKPGCPRRSVRTLSR